MKILKFVFKLVLLLIVAFIAVGFFLPANTSVSRSKEIKVSPDKLFVYLNDFQQFNRWSPWYGIDPEARYDYTGPDKGVGSKMNWSSEHPKVGSGSQEIIKSEPNSQVVTQLKFEGQGNAVATFQLEPVADSTRVTWGFETDWGNNLIGRYMGLMMDKWVGAEYDKGLAKLKQLAEGE